MISIIKKILLLMRLIKHLDIQLEVTQKTTKEPLAIKSFFITLDKKASIRYRHPGILEIDSGGVLDLEGGLVLINSDKDKDRLIDSYFQGPEVYDQYIESKLLIDDLEDSIDKEVNNVKESFKS
jgi:hypothetical protein